MSDGAFLVDGVAAFDALPRTLRYRGLESGGDFALSGVGIYIFL